MTVRNQYYIHEQIKNILNSVNARYRAGQNVFLPSSDTNIDENIHSYNFIHFPLSENTSFVPRNKILPACLTLMFLKANGKQLMISIFSIYYQLNFSGELEYLSIVTDCGLEDRCSIPGRGISFFF
jgi:hypothetical protein